jgi:cell division control protein 45
MYLPRGLIAQLYQNLVKRNHAAAPPVLLLVALEPDALCACRILTALLRRDYIPHKIQPIAGYGDLSRAAEDLIRPMRTTQGGSGGVVVCLGVGGMVDLEEIFGMEVDSEGNGGTGDVEVWLMDARRPWNLTNVFGTPYGQDGATGEWARKRAGVDKGRIQKNYHSSKGGIIVFDDGDIEEELNNEREAYCALEEMPDLGEEVESDNDDDDDDEGRDEARGQEPPSGQAPKKRKSWSEGDDSDEDMSEDERPRQRRRSNSVSVVRHMEMFISNRCTGRFNTIYTGTETCTAWAYDTWWLLRFLALRLPKQISVTCRSSTQRAVSQESPTAARGYEGQA